MWLVAHMAYAERVDLSGAPLPAEAFKPAPEGHVGGALNVVQAYVGYLTANLLDGRARGWILGQGHGVAAVEAVNALVGNLSPAQVGRYAPDTDGLSRLCADFYSYAIDPQGRPAAPLGSHVGPHTAGGVSEGGYLGFAELLWPHMALKGERLVAILSDGAFEEQRGSDWAERWWRAEDSGLATPVLVLNGRRIEQRTEIAQDGGGDWMARHLEANGFDPVRIDGSDPAAFAWAILESERRLSEAGEARTSGREPYPVRVPYVVAKTLKGFGFPGAGTDRAHNLPLPGNPRTDAAARAAFDAAARRLFVAGAELAEVRDRFDAHARQGRPKERDHPMARRDPPPPSSPEPETLPNAPSSPMAAIDAWFVRFVEANPGLRFRVGNPDELRSNQMGRTLERLKHRVNRPEPGQPEAVDGAVITALNEEAVVCAALGNKGGLNLVVSYEAFAMKMLGALRQEIIFARQQVEAARPPRWIGVPLLATSHVWENGKNQQSHQDPTIGEALLGEMSDVSRVMFPPDAASAVEAVRAIYGSRGTIGCLVVPKRSVAPALDAEGARSLVAVGAAPLDRETAPQVQFVAVGAYQLGECLKARARLAARGIRSTVTAVVEPGRLREPRDEIEAAFVLPDETLSGLFPPGLPRVLVSHTRPEVMTGVLRRIDPGPGRLRAHGYLNRGGTLDVFGMLFANRCLWAHLVLSAAELLGVDERMLLTEAETAAAQGRGRPDDLRSGA
jgi:phosphoketolase